MSGIDVGGDIDVGEGWRRLEPGEVIQEGDQWLANSCSDIWYDTESVGDKVRESDPLFYRRRRSPEVAALSSCLLALAARVEKIEAENTIDARRERAKSLAKDGVVGRDEAVVHLRERTPGEKSAFWGGMNSRMVNDLIRERDEARAECKKLSAANHAMDGVVTVLEARVSELKAELKLAKEANDGGFSNQPAISGDGKSSERGKQEPVKYAVVVGGEMRNTVYDDFREARAKASEIACRGTPHFVGVVALYREPPGGIPAPLAGGEAKQEPMAWMFKGESWFDGKIWHDKYETTKDEKVAKFKDKDAVPLYAAPPEPRGWLTPEERQAVRRVRDHLMETSGGEFADIVILDALLARETPPRVKRPKVILGALPSVREKQWRDAIREAGVEVE